MSISLKPIFSSYILPIIAMIAVIAASNILVQYSISDWLTWGAFTYPIVFLVSDLTNRIFGQRRAQLIAAIGFPFGMALSVVLSLQADLDVMSSIRISLASGFAFICAQLLDIMIFNRMRKMVWWRAPLFSSILASALDTVIFFCAAFIGTGLPWVTWALGDFGVKLAVAFIMLIPFKIFLSLLVAFGNSPQRSKSL
tara:strand:- start:36117 stop:36707 length:591 start_codon:yes stop_codon:yes gene_type:complete